MTGLPDARPPLRFAVMCSGDAINTWAADAIDRVIARADARLELFIVDPAVPQRSTLGARLKKSVLLQANLWHLHNKRFPLSAMVPHQPVVRATRWPSVPARTCHVTLHGKWTQRFAEPDLAYLRSLDLDFILKFGYGIIRGEILTVARHGVWSFHHDDEQQFRGGPPALWEIITGAPVQAAILQRLTERLDGGVVLDKIWVKTEPRSYRANLSRILTASADMPARAATALRAGRTERLDAPPVKTDAPIYVAPNDVQMVSFGARILRNFVEYKRQNQVMERWNIGVVRAPIHRFLDPDFVPEVEWAPYQKARRFIADPFAVGAADGVRIFCEEFSYETGYGVISELPWSPTAGWGEIRTVIDDGVHMSYPYPIMSAGRLRIVPECNVRRGVPSYREDAGRMVPDVDVLPGARLLDPTIFQHNGRWWMFGTSPDDEAAAKLRLYFGSSEVGPWTSHPANPVKTDVRNARPAGTPFVHEGRLYRPAQDCSVTYGGRLVINEVTELTPEHFDEIPVRTIGPLTDSPYPHGFHTLAACGEFTVVDGKREVLDASLLTYRLKGKLARRFGLSKR